MAPALHLEAPTGSPDPWRRSWLARGEGAEICGLLVYEPSGWVSKDAPGHWTALRQVHSVSSLDVVKDDSSGLEEGEVTSFLRLDPVRGPFRLTLEEATELTERY